MSTAKPLWPKLLAGGAAALGVALLVYALAWRGSGGNVQTSNSGSNTTLPVATAVESDKTPSASTTTIPFDKATATAMLPGNVKLEFVLVPAGKFTMGSPQSEKGRHKDEGPQHQVTISHEFYLGRYEITQGQWKSVMGALPDRCAFVPVEGRLIGEFLGDDKPITCLTWAGIQQFIQKLNAQSSDGAQYRLPTEAEWEYAARAGATGTYAGNLGEMSWYRENSGGKLHAVGQKTPNDWGLYDMSGNVAECVSDWYAEGYYANSPNTDPGGPEAPDANQYRTIRGESWYNDADECRSAARAQWATSIDVGTIGFRLVKVAS